MVNNTILIEEISRYIGVAFLIVVAFLVVVVDGVVAVAFLVIVDDQT